LGGGFTEAKKRESLFARVEEAAAAAVAVVPAAAAAAWEAMVGKRRLGFGREE
jgi:hypothetical protein